MMVRLMMSVPADFIGAVQLPVWFLAAGQMAFSSGTTLPYRMASNEQTDSLCDVLRIDNLQSGSFNIC